MKSRKFICCNRKLGESKCREVENFRFSNIEFIQSYTPSTVDKGWGYLKGNWRCPWNLNLIKAKYSLCIHQTSLVYERNYKKILCALNSLMTDLLQRCMYYEVSVINTRFSTLQTWNSFQVLIWWCTPTWILFTVWYFDTGGRWDKLTRINVTSK